MLAVPSPEAEEFTVVDPDGWKAVAFRWIPDREPRAAVHILHGLGEHRCGTTRRLATSSLPGTRCTPTTTAATGSRV